MSAALKPSPQGLGAPAVPAEAAPSAALPQLALHQASVRFGRKLALQQVDLAVRGGERVALVGANGSGKSTLLRLICGLQRPTRGAVRLRAGGQVYRPDQAPWLVGWVAPDLQLYRELSGLENLRFFADVRGLKHTDAQLEALLAEVGLGGRGGDLLAAYSSGMAQRLRYAYALLHAPPLLLLDEPTVTLDERGAALVEQVIARQRRRGITVVATNDPREERYGDYVLRLS